MDKYAQVFELRGHKYDAAMRAFPTARDEEFRQLFVGINVNSLKTVFDVPSGGGYLHRFVAPDAELTEFDPSPDFGLDGAQAIDLEHMKLFANSADLLVSLASLHHVSNKKRFFESGLKALRRGGWMCVGDVVAGSNIARFLDEFVGWHNGMGHSGDYLPFDPALFAKLAGKQAELVRAEIAPCPWNFRNASDLASFCRSLFGLKDVSDSLILDTLNAFIGIESTANGVALNWELLYLQFQAF